LRIVLIVLISSYFIGIVWYIIICDVLSEASRTVGFAREDWLNECVTDDSFTTMEALLIVWYFALTTLSTIGFGDFSPQTPEERLVGAIIMMFGVATFSFIMN